MFSCHQSSKLDSTVKELLSNLVDGGDGGNGREMVEEMTEIGDGKEEKASEARPVTFVNTRIVESKQRMGKRERGEMGGWLNLAKFMGAEGDDHTVDLPLDDDHIVHFLVEEKMHDGTEHPVNEKESCDKVQNDPVHYDMVKHPVYLDENEEIVYSRVERPHCGKWWRWGPFCDREW